MDAGAGRVQPLRPSAARAVLRGALDGLQYLHAQRIGASLPRSPLLLLSSVDAFPSFVLFANGRPMF